jgi:hypothetical protein
MMGIAIAREDGRKRPCDAQPILVSAISVTIDVFRKARRFREVAGARTVNAVLIQTLALYLNA